MSYFVFFGTPRVALQNRGIRPSALPHSPAPFPPVPFFPFLLPKRGSSWPRVIRRPRKRGGHVMLDLCTAVSLSCLAPARAFLLAFCFVPGALGRHSPISYSFAFWVFSPSGRHPGDAYRHQVAVDVRGQGGVPGGPQGESDFWFLILALISLVLLFGRGNPPVCPSCCVLSVSEWWGLAGRQRLSSPPGRQMACSFI